MSEHKQHDGRQDETQGNLDEARAAEPGMAPGTGMASASVHEGNRMQAPATSMGGSGGIGGMQRAEQFGTSAAHAGRNVLRGAVSTTEEVGTGIVGGAAHIATDLVHGVTDLGYEVRNGATGLIGAVGDIGSAAVHTVAGLLVDVVGGVRQVVGAAVRGPDGAARQAGAMQMQQYPDQGRPSAAGRLGDEPRV